MIDLEAGFPGATVLMTQNGCSDPCSNHSFSETTPIPRCPFDRSGVGTHDRDRHRRETP